MQSGVGAPDPCIRLLVLTNLLQYNRLLVPCLSCGIIMEQERRLRLVRLSRILFNKLQGSPGLRGMIIDKGQD